MYLGRREVSAVKITKRERKKERVKATTDVLLARDLQGPGRERERKAQKRNYFAQCVTA